MQFSDANIAEDSLHTDYELDLPSESEGEPKAIFESSNALEYTSKPPLPLSRIKSEEQSFGSKLSINSKNPKLKREDGGKIKSALKRN